MDMTHKKPGDFTQRPHAAWQKLAAQQANVIMDLNRNINRLQAAANVPIGKPASCLYPECGCVDFCAITWARKPTIVGRM